MAASAEESAQAGTGSPEAVPATSIRGLWIRDPAGLAKLGELVDQAADYFGSNNVVASRHIWEVRGPRANQVAERLGKFSTRVMIGGPQTYNDCAIVAHYPGGESGDQAALVLLSTAGLDDQRLEGLRDTLARDVNVQLEEADSPHRL